VLVCTDSAARGIDIPGVTHVVQADFAATAVDFLHRVLTKPLTRTHACSSPSFVVDPDRTFVPNLLLSGAPSAPSVTKCSSARPSQLTFEYVMCLIAEPVPLALM